MQIIIGLIIGLLVLGYSLFDVPVNPKAEKFFKEKPFDPENNFHIAWMGLHAPKDTNNTYAYGLKKYEQIRDNQIPEGKKRFYDGIRFELDEDIDNKLCNQQEDFKDPEKDCAEGSELIKIYEDNKIMLNRFRDLMRTTELNVNIGNRWDISGLGQDAISMQRFLSALAIYQAEIGQGEAALQDWIAAVKMHKHLKRGKITIVEHAIWMINYGALLSNLPVLLETDPSLLPQYKDEIIEILDFDYNQNWNIQGMSQAEYEGFRMIEKEAGKKIYENPFYKPNATKNKFFKIQKQKIALAKLKPVEIIKTNKILHNRYDCYKNFFNQTRCYSFNYIGNILISGMLKGTELFVNGYSQTLYQKMLILWIEAKAQGIKSEDMPAFLKASNPKYYNLLTEKPFDWDAEKSSLYFEIQREGDKGPIRRDIYY